MTLSEQEKVFDEWMARHRGLIFRVVKVYAFTSEDQDDLFQNIALQLWLSITTFKRDAKPSTWIYRVSLNTAIKWLQKEQKHSKGRQSEMHFDQVLQVQDPGASNDRLTWLYEQISSLGEIDRSLCLLLLDGYSHRDMADILGISESNVAVKIHRIKKFLIQKSASAKALK